MKRLALITFVAVLAIAQTPAPTPTPPRLVFKDLKSVPFQHAEVHVSALQQERVGAVRHLIGLVTIESEGMILRADKADFNDDTGEILAHGDVRVKLK